MSNSLASNTPHELREFALDNGYSHGDYADTMSKAAEELDSADRKIKQLRAALRWSLEWIDAVPTELALPVMPGFDRDFAEGLIAGYDSSED